jgi:hypothetical protein
MKRNGHHSAIAVLLLMQVLSMLRVPTVSSLALVPFFHLERGAFLSAILQPTAAAAFAFDNSDSSARKYGQSTLSSSIGNNDIIDVVYQPLSVTVSGVQVPVAAWHRAAASSSSMQPLDSYQHRISVQKIGKKLAGWTFIPTFVNRNFSLTPGSQNSNIRVVSTTQQLPSSAPVVILAHGYRKCVYDN